MNRKKLFSEVNENMTNLFGEKLRKIILYGSYARNKQGKESDIDFLVLVDDTAENLQKSKYQIADVMTRLSLNHDILVSITEESFSRYQNYSDALPFYRNVIKDGIAIYGE